MPLFVTSSPYDTDVEKATSELNVEENVSLFRKICDEVKHAPTPGARDCLRAIVKRINNKVPHVALQALSLLDMCVQNCGYFFQLEIASADFISECRTIIGSGKAHTKVIQKLKMLIKKWAESEFKSDSALKTIPALYASLKSEGHKFNFEDALIQNTVGKIVSSESQNMTTEQEEADIAKAIALSLKEQTDGKPKSQQSSSLYPVANVYPSPTSNMGNKREPRKVRTLYDFEAVEDNELTFKAGEIISVIDDSDVNWWKGFSSRGEGLFPANFVTADLTAEPEEEHYKVHKSVHFHDEVEVKVLDSVPPLLQIDERKIEEALALIQNSDPSDPDTDSAELLTLEEQCKEMGPMIDEEIISIDGTLDRLGKANEKLMEAFQMYHNLMKELPSYGYAALTVVSSQPPPLALAQQSQGYTSQQVIPSQLPAASSHLSGVPTEAQFSRTLYSNEANETNTYQLYMASTAQDQSFQTQSFTQPSNCPQTSSYIQQAPYSSQPPMASSSLL